MSLRGLEAKSLISNRCFTHMNAFSAVNSEQDIDTKGDATKSG